MSASEPTSAPVPKWAQLLAWLTGLAMSMAGLFDKIPGWSFPYAMTSVMLLATACIAWGWRPRRRRTAPVVPRAADWRTHLVTVVGLMACSLGMSAWTARQIGWNLPPIYHDEYSYLFQAKTFLAGRTWVPSHATHPELFNQIHVLNDVMPQDQGKIRMASRYFPGTGLWMAPFVAWGHPYAGHWICGMLTTAFVYAAACELGNFRTGRIAGLLTALSPGLALFSNLLLAHHPTLVGLSFFLWRMARLQRTHQGFDAWLAGFGLTWAMLCRPMTAAGFGLPFGLWTLWWLLKGPGEFRQKRNVFLGFAVPIGLGLVLQLSYNASITGNPASSPYQLYTDIYTPRHVYGFNNVVRGEQHLGPKTLDQYDRWALNLDGNLAAKNVGERLVYSLLWTWDLLPLTMISLILLGVAWSWEFRRQHVLAAILSLHLVHIPYWFAGIMHWHYVFESAILWIVASGLVLDQLLSHWRAAGYPLLAWWLMAFSISTVAGNWCHVPGAWQGKVAQELPNFRSPRRTLQEFRDWTTRETHGEPSLVLVAPHQREPHLDYVVNDPGLEGPVLYGRLIPGTTDLTAVVRDFPERTVWLCKPDQRQIRRLPR